MKTLILAFLLTFFAVPVMAADNGHDHGNSWLKPVEAKMVCMMNDKVFDSEAHEKAWIIRVTINACKDLLKSFFRKHTVSLDAYVEQGGVVDAAHSEVLEAVLEAQPGWHDDPKVTQAWAAAERVGLNLEQARQDMHTPGVNAVLETDMQDVKAVGVRGTPTFFVNGRALSEFGPEPLRQLVSSEVAKARE